MKGLICTAQCIQNQNHVSATVKVVAEHFKKEAKLLDPKLSFDQLKFDAFSPLFFFTEPGITNEEVWSEIPQLLIMVFRNAVHVFPRPKIW